MANRLHNNLGCFCPRRLSIEALETRLLLTGTEPLWSVDNPSTVAQAGAEFGFETANDSGWLVVGAPAADAGGLPNAGEVYVFDEATGQLTTTLPNPQPATGDRFGEALAISGSLVVVGAFRSDAGAVDAGVAYVFDHTTGQLLHTLSSPTPDDFDFFGSAVAIDGNTVVVGSYLDDAIAPNGGAAYVFDATDGSLTHTLTRSSEVSFDYFGAAVAVGNGRIAVGAERADIGASDSGEVIIFDAVTGTNLATYANPTPADFEYFGRSIAIDGDRLVTGAHRDDTEAVNAGHAYVFDLVSGQLQQTFTNPFPSLSDNFGFDVDVQGDTVLVGAYRDDNGHRDAGEAYLLDAITGDLIQTLSNPNPALLDYFGHSVTLSASHANVGGYWNDAAAQDAGLVVTFDATTGVELDSISPPVESSYDYFGQTVAVTDARVIVGAPFSDISETDAGSVYVYDSAGVLEQQFSHPTPSRFDNFGVSLAATDNVVAVGATGVDVGGTANAGSVLLFDLTTGSLVRTFTSPTPAANDQFGSSVSLQGDEIAIGVPQEDTDGTNSGAVYVFDVNTGGLIQRLANPTPDPFDQFGFSVAIDDGLLAAGSRSDDVIVADAGAAYVFDATSGAILTTLTDPAGSQQDNFGSAVAIQGNRVVVGAPGKNTGGTNAGSAFLYETTTGTLVTELTNPAPTEDAFFGSAVALSPTYAVVGAYSARLEGVSGGATFLFSATSGFHQDTLQSPTPETGDLFGFHVAASDTRVVAGAPQHDGTSVDRGAAYIFDGQLPATPIASAGGPYATMEGESITFDASMSSDANQPTATLTFEWDLDYDGVTFDVDTTGASPTVLFEDDLNGDVAVRVTDNSELSSIATASMTITNVAPTLTPDSTSVKASEGDIAELMGSVSDPGADSVGLEASIGNIIDLGDGRWAWTYQTGDGPDESSSVIITASDDDNATSLVSIVLDVTNVAPAFTADRSYVPVLTGGTAVNSGTVFDAGDDTISLSASAGVIIDNLDGTWSWSLAGAIPGDSQSVTLTATDSDGAESHTFFSLAIGSVLPNHEIVLVDEADTAVMNGIIAAPSTETVQQLTASIGTITDNANGTWTWEYTALDGPDNTTEVVVTADFTDGSQDTTAFDLVVNNAAPQLTVQRPTVSVRAGRTATNTGLLHDVGDDTISLAASLGQTVDNGNGTWSWSLPRAQVSDSQTITITATDSDGAETVTEFILDVRVFVMLGQDPPLEDLFRTPFGPSILGNSPLDSTSNLSQAPAPDFTDQPELHIIQSTRRDRPLERHRTATIDAIHAEEEPQLDIRFFADLENDPNETDPIWLRF